MDDSTEINDVMLQAVITGFFPIVGVKNMGLISAKNMSFFFTAV
jgi:hypothetical protein